MQRLTLALVAALILAGCAGAPASDDLQLPAPKTQMDLVGMVTDIALVPQANITLTIPALNASTTTDARGEYLFAQIPAGAWLVSAQGVGFYNATAASDAPENGTARLDFILDRLPVKLAYVSDPIRFKGFIECASETIIVSGPCDALVRAGGQSVFNNESSFKFGVDSNWATVVLDFSFDLSNHPGIAAMRMAVRGQGAANELGAYGQYARVYDSQSFSLHLAPGKEYPEGTAGPVDGNLTAFQVEIYPQGQAYHEVCDPTNQFGCFLGVGAARGLEFELAVTVFYYDPAPEDYTLLV